MKLKTCLFAFFFSSVLVSTTAFADDDDHEPLDCPSGAIAAMDAKFGNTASGLPSSEITTCLQSRERVKAMLTWNLDSTHKSGNGQQVKNAENLMNNYEDMYSMAIGEDYQIVIVSYGKGGKWILTDEAYMAKFGTTNPSRALVDQLISRGATIYMCQNTMKGNSWTASDLIPGVKMVPSGVSAVIDFQYSGFKYLNP